jgi:hypothetical protein
VEPDGCVRHGALDAQVELVHEIVARARPARRDAPHVAAVEHPAALVIERKAARPGRDNEVAFFDLGQASRDWVAKVVVGEVEEVGAAAATGSGTRIDRHAKELAGAVDEDLVVGRVPMWLDLPVDDAAREQGVRPGLHVRLHTRRRPPREIFRTAVILLQRLQGCG